MGLLRMYEEAVDVNLVALLEDDLAYRALVDDAQLLRDDNSHSHGVVQRRVVQLHDLLQVFFDLLPFARNLHVFALQQGVVLRFFFDLQHGELQMSFDETVPDLWVGLKVFGDACLPIEHDSHLRLVSSLRARLPIHAFALGLLKVVYYHRDR